jgi:outer membrane protein assembly factor BamB
MSEWPKDGPKLIWKASDIGAGYSTPAVVGGRLYLLASSGVENEVVEALDATTHQKIWSTRLGKVGDPNQQPNFPTARSTPTVDGDLLFALSSDGDLACLDTKTGNIRWKKSLRADFGGKSGPWAFAESPLVDGDAVICAPGGKDATVVALKKVSGDLIWKCALPEGDDAAFSSAIVIEAAGRRQYVRLLTKGLVGIDAGTGQLLWRYGKPVSRYSANIQTPVASGDYIFCSSTGTGAGVIRLKAQGDRIQAEEVYFEPKFPTAIGGVVKVGDYLYGTTGDAMLCMDFKTGEIKWKERALGAASLCYADKRLYMHGENGDVAMIEPTPEGYREKGHFSPPGQPTHSDAIEKAWAYPVVADGRLYIRDNNVLWCYAVGLAQ